jgi:hypothetical protein
MEPEDGRLYICDIDDDIAVTPAGVDNLKELVEIHNANRQAGSRE